MLTSFHAGLDLLKNNRFTEASVYFLKAVAGNHEAPASWHHNLGLSYQLAGNIEAAREAYRTAVACHPGNAILLGKLARLEAQLHEYSDAEEHYRDAWRLQPDKLEHVLDLDAVLRKQEKYQEADAVLDAALRLHHQDTEACSPSDSIRIINALFHAGRFEPALEILLTEARRGQPQLKLTTKLALLADRLAKSGEVDKAVDAFKHLASNPTYANETRPAYLAFSKKFSIFEDDVLEIAESFLREPAAPMENKATAIDLLRLFHGPKPRLCAAALDLVGAGHNDRNFILSTATMLFVEGRLSELEALGNAHKLSDHGDRNLGAAYYTVHLAKGRIPAHRIAAANLVLMAFYATQADQQSLLARIADSNHSICIVGNSSCELGRSRGNDIDSHDTVIRFNNFDLSPAYDTDYGRKVDCIVRVARRSDEHDAVCLKYRHALIVVSGLNVSTGEIDWSFVVKLLSQGLRVCTLPDAPLRDLLRQLRRYPSNGLIAAYSVKMLRKPSGKTSFFGFSFTDQTGAGGKPSHYFENSSPSLLHDWERESRIFHSRIAQQPRTESAPPPAHACRIKFIGDHSHYHAGSAAVGSYIVKEIQSMGTLVMGGDYDVLIVNGEGSMHHDSPTFLKKMAQIQLALDANKKVYLINSVWQHNDPKWNETLHRLNGIAVREKMSHDDLQDRHGVKSQTHIDLSYWSDIDPDAAFTDHDSRTVVGDFYSREFEDFVQLKGGPLGKYSYIDMKNISWSSLVLSLKTASLLVTGRHHAVFAACKARTPFVALRGNTHKIEGLISMSGFPILVCESPSEILQAMRWANENQQIYEQFFDWMEQQERFSLGAFMATHL